MTRKDQLLRQFAKAEVERRALLARLEPLPTHVLERPPSPGSWSVAQVIAHLALAEARSVDYLEHKLRSGDHAPVGASSGPRLLLLRAALRLPLRFKAPAVVATLPPCTFVEARQAWDQVRSRMAAAYAALPPEVAIHGLFKHPSAGRFDPVQGLAFMRGHVRHHRAQILRTIRQVTA
jgi:uncharacterized damage-inducible protein DinB